jgi:predicted nucleic acid-binding protein
MYTIDASVWVNSFDQKEKGHETSRQFLAFVGQKAVPIAAPTLVLAEVAGAVSRTRKDSEQAQAFALALRGLPNLTLINLDADFAEQSLQLAARHGLRGADAVYAAVALETGFTLVSLDNEHLTRLTDVVPVKTPADVLAEFTAESQ